MSSDRQLSGCLVRLFWMLVGNLGLLLAAIGIGENHAGFTLTGRDIFFWAVALSLVAVRYVDIRCLEGRTADNNRPASVSDWRRYAATVFGISLAVWLVAHSIP
jgi:hypothetical protein